MTAAQHSGPRYQIGDRVRFPFGQGKLDGVVVEDRGNLGVGGRRLLLVDTYLSPDIPQRFLMAEEEPEPAPEEPEPLDHAQVVRYLKSSGLESILGESAPGARIRPRVWLCHNSLGNVT